MFNIRLDFLFKCVSAFNAFSKNDYGFNNLAPIVASDTELCPIEDTGKEIEPASDLERISYHPLLRNIELRYIYIVGTQEVREELFRVVLVELSESYAAVKAIYRMHREDRLEYGS